MKRVIVKARFTGVSVEVGELVLRERKVYFKYYSDFLDREMKLSPFYLKQTEGIQQAGTEVFDGLFGVFADSLPDGWGRLLLDRALTTKGIRLEEIDMLDRLAFVGENGPGTLSYHPVKSGLTSEMADIDLDEIVRESNLILAGDSSEIVEELVQLGGSSGGARPKIVVGHNPKTDQLVAGANSLPEGFEDWIIKFPATVDPVDIARTELAYHKMALAAGLDMHPSSLFTGQSGQVYFGTKRFDRQGNNRLHLHSAAGLMHDNFRLTNMDYGHVMDAAFRLEQDRSAYEKVLRLAAFNVFAHNRDDHSKNISFLMDASGNWRLAPVYDLTFSQSSHGYHSMTVGGESKSPGRKDLLRLAKSFAIKKPERIIDEAREAVNRWPEFAEASSVPKDSILRINRVLNP
jgi:serine/threonine-protein kinase HipA